MGIESWFIKQAVDLGKDGDEVIAVLKEQGLSNRGLVERIVAAKQLIAGVREARKAVAAEAIGDYAATGKTEKLKRGMIALGTPRDVVDIDMKAAQEAADAANSIDFSSEAE